MYVFPFAFTILTSIAFDALRALISCVDSVDKHNTQCIACFDPLYRLSQHKIEATASFYVHTDKVLYCSGFFII